jgi:hypothetical protein
MVRAALVELSSHLLKAYCVPAVPACGVAKVTVHELPAVQVSVFGVVKPVPAEQPVPLTPKVKPVGDEVMVACGAKLATTDSAALMVIVVAALLELATVLPVQLVNAKPVLGVACRLTTVPELKNWPDRGVAVPPPVVDTVSSNCVLNVAV